MNYNYHFQENHDDKQYKRSKITADDYILCERSSQSVLTGGISLLQLDPKYIAIKEAAIPGLIGLAVILSQKSHRSVVKLMIFNDKLIQMDKVNEALASHNNEALFDKKMSVVTYIVAMSFFVSYSKIFVKEYQ